MAPTLQPIKKVSTLQRTLKRRQQSRQVKKAPTLQATPGLPLLLFSRSPPFPVPFLLTHNTPRSLVPILLFFSWSPPSYSLGPHSLVFAFVKGKQLLPPEWNHKSKSKSNFFHQIIWFYLATKFWCKFFYEQVNTKLRTALCFFLVEWRINLLGCQVLV